MFEDIHISGPDVLLAGYGVYLAFSGGSRIMETNHIVRWLEEPRGRGPSMVGQGHGEVTQSVSIYKIPIHIVDNCFVLSPSLS